MSFLILIGCKDNYDYSKLNWGDSASDIRCSIHLEYSKISRGNNAIVHIFIQNISNETVSILAIPSFDLGNHYICCPVDFDGNHLPANNRARLILGSNDVLEFSADLTRLTWGLGFLSIWPCKNIYSLIDNGEYNLQYSMDIYRIYRGKNRRILSNIVELSITN